ncbi:GloB Zn-dependent hydrolases, including glyoxylases [Rhabdaerophilaceae bacterium]
MKFNRRDFFAHSALAGASIAAGAGSLSLGSTAAFARAPMAGTQSPSFFRFKVGEFEVTALHDGNGQFPLPPNFVRNADIKDVQAILAESGQPTDKWTNTFTTLLVNTGSKLVLIDTGFADNGAPTNGKTVAQMKAAGIEPSQVDVILLSHFHGDHLQGTRLKDGKLTYPNAEIMVPEMEWAFWMDDAKLAAAPDAMKGAFAGVHRVLKPSAADVKRFKWGDEVVTGITAVDASGHTPGHTAFMIASGTGKLMYVADTTNNPAVFARNPEWRVMYDMDPEKSVATRKRLLDMAATDKIQISFYHGNFPSTGFIAREGAGYRLVPAPWLSTV